MKLILLELEKGTNDQGNNEIGDRDETLADQTDH